MLMLAIIMQDSGCITHISLQAATSGGSRHECTKAQTSLCFSLCLLLSMHIAE